MTATLATPGTRRRPAAPRRRMGRSAERWLLFAAALVLTLIVLLPVIVIVLTAFKPASEINAYPPTLLPGTWTLDNFARIFRDLPFGRLFVNSFVFAGGVTLCALAFDSLAAYALARIDFAGSRLLLIV